MRKTKIRSNLLDIFENTPKPLSAPEIVLTLKKINIHANKTTIYRELAFLKENGFVREVLWDDNITRFEKSDPNCHHHLVCTNCNCVEDFNLDHKFLFKKINENSKFKIMNHSIEFFGLCSNCQ